MQPEQGTEEGWILEGEKYTSYISDVTWYINKHLKD